MPENLTGYERRIINYVAKQGLEVSRSKCKRIAHRLHKRQARMTDLELERIFTHSDPTPREVFRRLEAENHYLVTA